MSSGSPFFPPRPLAVFRDVVATKVWPVTTPSGRYGRPMEQVPRFLAYGRTDGVVSAIRRVRTAAKGIGENHPQTGVTFTARERIGEAGSLLIGSWKGAAVGQLITSGKYSELISWHYELEDDRVSDQVEHSPVTIARGRNKPRIGLIGAGAFAWNVVIPALRSAGADVVAVTDASRLRSAALATAANIPVTVDPPSALLQPGLGLDGVVIACAHSAHASYACSALRAGYEVLVEKPAAMNDDELKLLVEAARLSGHGLYVGHNRRYARAFDRMVQEAKNGPSYLYAMVEGYPLGPLHWYRAPDQGGRVLGNLTHWIDLAIAVHGDRLPTELRAASVIGEGLGVDLKFAGGSLAELRLLDVGRRVVTGRETVTLVAPTTSIRVEDWRRVVQESSQSTKVQQGRRSRGHDRSYRAWVGSLSAVEGMNEELIAQLVRSHHVTFEVLRRLEAGDEVWRALDMPSCSVRMPGGM